MGAKPPVRFTPSCAAPSKQVFEFRPMGGALSLLERVAKQAGLGHLWDGEDGLKSVTRQFLKEYVGIPEGPIPLTGPGGKLTPRGIAETAGLVKKTKRAKRCTD